MLTHGRLGTVKLNGVFFLDLAKTFLTPYSTLRREYYKGRDNLHLNEEGNQVFGNIVRHCVNKEVDESKQYKGSRLYLPS